MRVYSVYALCQHTHAGTGVSCNCHLLAAALFFLIARARESDALSVLICTQRRGRRFVRLCMLAAFVAWYLMSTQKVMCRVVLACV